MNLHIPSKLQLIKFPASAEMTLFLISEEMKNRRYMNKLEEAGFDTCYTCDLSVLILTLVGFNTRPDDLYEWYTALLDETCTCVLPSEIEEWKQAAFDMYVTLLEKKKGVVN